LVQTLISTHDREAAPPHLRNAKGFPVKLHNADKKRSEGLAILRPGMERFLRRLAGCAEVDDFTAARPGDPQLQAFAALHASADTLRTRKLS
jgi:hypothetical protein